MHQKFSAEELIVNDSFINYCEGSSFNDKLFWENYINQYPEEYPQIEKARIFVLEMKQMLKQEQKENSLAILKSSLAAIDDRQENAQQQNQFWQVVDRMARVISGRRVATVSVAATILVFSIITWSIVSSRHSPVPEQSRTAPAVTQINLGKNQTVTTGRLEKRVVFLPDSTKITMNAGTVLKVDRAFGDQTRMVELEGEAFFDVTHNAKLPFIVRLKTFDIKVLGTMFNVRSYAADRTSEAALMKGKIQIIVKKHPLENIFIHPNQKALLTDIPEDAPAARVTQREEKKGGGREIEIKAITVSNDGIGVVETAWMKGRLELNDESFEEIKNKLERWYGVDIELSKEVLPYRFTATFEKENIDQALKALQMSYSFTYSKTNNKILIRK